ncbi:ATP-binding protein [Streptomyces sp. NBC_01429]|uniref:ATP-binding protein n=1 Tax=Streptomyces sp. NBC_01429 TaxID=2903862 RepID=UPI002E2A2EF4|nr:ATP-binding protein [Streptomyces sp. NBC_01429]
MRPLKDCPPAGRPIDRDADCGMSLRDLGSALALDVADEGTHALDAKSLFARGATTGPGSGIGLALARELAGAAGARIALSGTAPTRFTLLLLLSGRA